MTTTTTMTTTNTATRKCRRRPRDARNNGRSPRFSAAVMVLVLVVLVRESASLVPGFAPSSSRTVRPWGFSPVPGSSSAARSSSTSPSSSTKTKTTTFLASTPPRPAEEEDDEDDDRLSDVDARVLQSMLQDQKLNLQDEENMKRLLERGVKTDEPVSRQARAAAEEAKEKQESDYSSEVLRTLGNTKLWKGLSRNAADWFESAKIWAQNKVERDAKLIASLGIFAFDRALSDVKRALPASAAEAVEKAVPSIRPKQNLLSTTSSAAETENIRNQMATPQDEFRAVAQELQTIISSGGDRGGTSLGVRNRALKSAASSKAGKDRFLKAYQRQKETTLKREQENLAQTSARMAGSVMDSAYRVKRELEVEPNQPGYKTKALREGAAQTSRLLASGAKGLLSGARAAAQAALPSSRKDAGGPRGFLPETTSTNPPPMDAAAAANTGAPFLDADAAVMDASVVREPPRTMPGGVSGAPINARIPGTSSSSSPPRSPFFGTAPGATEAAAEEDLFFASREAPDFLRAGAEEVYEPAAYNTDDPQLLEDAFFVSEADPATEAEAMAYSAEVVEADFQTSWEQKQQQEAYRAAFVDDFEYVDAVQEGYNGAMGEDDDESFVDDYELVDEDPQETLRRVRAEIVSDEDFEVAVGQAKEVDNTAGREVDFVDEEEKEPGPLTLLALRLLDVLFLVLEKVVFAIPGILSSLPMIAARVAAVQNRGMGSRGWQTIAGAQRGDRRY